MLVMTTIFISVMQMLPATAYVKMIDIWLIFGQLVPFAEVVLLTAMEYIREGDGSGEEEMSSLAVVKLGDQNEGDEKAAGPDREAANKHMFWLKVTGDRLKVFKVNLFSEKKILPALVVVFSLLYVSIAILFYTRYI